MLWKISEELKIRKQKLLESGYEAYCFYVLLGQEISICNELNNLYEYLLATPLTKVSHRSRGGNKYDIQEIMLGGYVFCYMPKDKDVFKIKPNKNSIKVLNWKNNQGRLYGSDRDYADWILDVEGILTVSEAININGKIKIINGPLKNLEGNIIKYSKHNRNCKIEIHLFNQVITTWLPFEWVDIDIEDINIKR